jgi:hypothetical protein
VLGKEAIHHSLAVHSQWIESNRQKKHKVRPARLNDTLQGGSWETTKSVREEIVKQRSKTLRGMETNCVVSGMRGGEDGKC